MRAIFLDKDGTLVDDVPYNVNPRNVRFTDGAEEALRRLHGAGFKIFIVSNQPGLARGYFSLEELQDLEGHLRRQFTGLDVPLAGFYYCPHDPHALTDFIFPLGIPYATDFTPNPALVVECNCRKPKPGLIKQAALEHGLSLEHSWMIGDILHDVEAGHAAGVKSILLDMGNETEWDLSGLRHPDHICRDLLEAANLICEQTR